MKRLQRLYDVRTKIDINDYSLKEYAEFLESFDGITFKIVFTDSLIKPVVFSLRSDNLVHLIGLHYCYDKSINKRKYVGREGLEILKDNNITIQKLRTNFMHNANQNKNEIKLNWFAHILPRLEWLPCFLNKIGKNKNNMFVCHNNGLNTSLKGEYLLFKAANKIYLILSLKSIGEKYVCETFICNDGLNYYDPIAKLEIKKIEIL